MPGKRKLDENPRNADECKVSEPLGQLFGRKRIRHCEENVEESAEQGEYRDISSFTLESSSNFPGKAFEKDGVIQTSNAIVLNESTHPLTILPEEVWAHILDNLNDSSDLENVSNSNLLFRQLLLNQRTCFLFRHVWEVLERFYEKNYRASGNIYVSRAVGTSGNDDDNEKQTNTRQDFLTARRWRNEVIQLRLVSRAWCKGLDDFYQDRPHLESEMRVNFDYWNMWYLVPKDYRLHSANLVDFLEHFDPTHNGTERNPFFGRKVALTLHVDDDYDIDDDDVEFFVEVCDFLMKYGRNIWYLTIEFYDYSSETVLYSMLQDVLVLVPNIKFLFIDMGIHVSLDQLVILSDEVSPRSLPKLKELQMLRTKNNLSHFICDQLIKSNAHISTLVIDGSDLDEGNDIFNTPLPNIRTLSIKVVDESEFLKLSEPVVDYWRLTELCLNFLPCYFINWQRVFHMLHDKFANTLIRLTMNLPVADDQEDKDLLYRERHTFKLHLPHLTRLDLYMENLCCLDFLLPMRDSITELHLDVDVHQDKLASSRMKKIESGHGRVIKLIGCVQSPFMVSNIFKCFPIKTETG